MNLQGFPEVSSTKTAPRFLWGEGCSGWWLKKNGSFTVISELMPSATSEVRHIHQQTEQFFYVLEGVLTLELDRTEYTLNPHDSIGIRPGVPHRVFNHSNGDVRFLVVSYPDSHEDRIDL